MAHVVNNAMRHSAKALFELKSPKNMQQKDHCAQAVCELLVAFCLIHKPGAVSVLTDLNQLWAFFWFAELSDALRMELRKLKLGSSDGVAGLAKHLAENLNDESCQGTLPTTFLHQLSLDEVMNKLIEFCEIKHAHCSGSSSCEPQDGKAAESKDCLLPSGDRQGGPLGLQDNGGELPTTGTGGIANALQFFAPPSGRGIADELDLLDMVDEAEQCKIVQSFVAKHMVLFATGGTVL